MSPIIHYLHWLPVVDGIVYKLSTMTYSTAFGNGRRYLFELTTIHHLHSVHIHKCVIFEVWLYPVSISLTSIKLLSLYAHGH